MPGNPRPALPNDGVRSNEAVAPVLGASWFVVEGVRILAGKPLVGADSGWLGGVVIGP
jgi:hypothetical protein